MIWHVIIFVIGLLPGVFLGILIAKRNPRIVEWCNTLYLRLRGKAATTVGEIRDRIGDEKGSAEVSPVSANVLVKYLLRFGLPLAGVIGLIALLKAGTISLVLYKCCLILTGFILAEGIWVVGYKYIFGKIEKEGISEYDRRSIMLFRGMLYAAIILGLTAGL